MVKCKTENSFIEMLTYIFHIHQDCFWVMVFYINILAQGNIAVSETILQINLSNILVLNARGLCCSWLFSSNSSGMSHGLVS